MDVLYLMKQCRELDDNFGLDPDEMRMKPVKRIVMKESMFKQREVKVCEEGWWVVKFVRLGIVSGQKLIRDLQSLCSVCHHWSGAKGISSHDESSKVSTIVDHRPPLEC